MAAPSCDVHAALSAMLNVYRSAQGPRTLEIGPWSTTCGIDPGRCFCSRPALRPAGECVPQVVAMREALGRHFDLVVVIWVLALAVGWSMATLSKATLSADQWSAPPSGPAWVIPSGNPAQ